MEDAAPYTCARLRPPVPTLGAARPTLRCPTCRGTGALGRKQEMVAHGDTLLVLTSTRWCPTCKGAGLVEQETEPAELVTLHLGGGVLVKDTPERLEALGLLDD